MGHQSAAGRAAGKYLVDESGQAQYLIDSGIGGRLTKTASGTAIKSSIRRSPGSSPP